MKILVAGATGALGRRLVPLLTAAGHEVTGLTRSPAKVGLLRSMGAEPIVADALVPSAVINAVRQQKPEIVVHELTSIKKAKTKGEVRLGDNKIRISLALRDDVSGFGARNPLCRGIGHCQNPSTAAISASTCSSSGGCRL
jgi:NAD(P)-dependent dehydrogenase (short-subunit alcohol dehydrogenase family)